MSEGTTPKFAENAKYADWFKEYNFGNCKLNREEYTRFLANYITSEQDGFVLNLNGSWGTGKTHFLKRLYTHLLQDKGHPTIYIDAWESDFTNNPLQVVCSELLEQLTALNSNMGSMSRPLKKLFGSVLKGSTVAAATYFGDKIGQKDAAVEAVKSMWDSAPDEMVDRLSAEYQEQVTAIKKIREELTGLAETLATNCSAQTPVVVLIDELDRCRPNYAIELLEVVKHFFTTEKFVFVVASDTEQLKESIKTIYGNDFKSDVYLRRFFNTSAKLEKPDLLHFVNAKYGEESTTPIRPKAEHQKIGHSTKYPITQQLADICTMWGFSLRDVEQVVSRYKACLSFWDSETVISPSKLISYLVEQHISPDQPRPKPSEFNSTIDLIDEVLFDTRNLKQKMRGQSRYPSSPQDQQRVRFWLSAIDKMAEGGKIIKIAAEEDYKKITELSGTLTGMDTE